ncbi:repeat protein [Moumouvirus goulette]|uniref:Repeat protein n=1 Tax=Moumouvirus goulette TaxID=1247379 RepID=M1PMC6_9VIRU|nr:repeat protein [Moumouvirus goulette]AGF85096.1 repeat protein [Moumouvirus goulette]
MDTYYDSLDLNDDNVDKFETFSYSKYESDIYSQTKDLQLDDVTVNNFYKIDDITQQLYLKFLVHNRKYSSLYKFLEIYPNIFFENNILFYSILYNSTLTDHQNIIYDLIKLFIEKGFDVTSNNNLAIKLASKSPFKILNLIIENGADVTVDNNFPIRNCLNHDCYKKFLLLIKNGADPYVNNYYVLKKSIGSLDIIQYYIELGVDINIDDGICLRRSIFDGHFKTIKFLLKNGADVTLLNNYDILLVIQSRNINILNILVDSGLDLSRINSFCESKINKSDALQKWRNTFLFLINEGVDPFNIIYIMDLENV